MSIRIMVVDDHDLLRETIKLSLLSYDDFKLVGEAANGVEAVDLCPVVEPNIVLMDVHMPEMDGVTATQLIRQRHPQVKVITMTSFFSDESLKDTAISAGASAYVLKNVSIDELAAVIRTVADTPPNGVVKSIHNEVKYNIK